MGKKFLVRCTFLEIYQDELVDLLSVNSEAHLDIKDTPETGVYVKVCLSHPDLNGVISWVTNVFIHGLCGFPGFVFPCDSRSC